MLTLHRTVGAGIAKLVVFTDILHGQFRLPSVLFSQMQSADVAVITEMKADAIHDISCK